MSDTIGKNEQEVRKRADEELTYYHIKQFIRNEYKKELLAQVEDFVTDVKYSHLSQISKMCAQEIKQIERFLKDKPVKANVYKPEKFLNPNYIENYCEYLLSRIMERTEELKNLEMATLKLKALGNLNIEKKGRELQNLFQNISVSINQ